MKQSITNELTRLEQAIADIEAAMERLELAEPVADEERDNTRAALKASQAHVAILRAQAARGEIKADVLASALEAQEMLEASLADDSALEAHYNRLCALHETLKQQHDDAYARLGKATYTSLRTELSNFMEKADKAEQSAQAARLALNDARQAMAGKLSAWPALASDARAKYASAEPRINHAERVLSALLALFDAIEDGRGQVPTVVNGVNIMGFFEMTPERADAVLHRSIGRVVDDRVKQQAQGLLAALRSMRKA